MVLTVNMIISEQWKKQKDLLSVGQFLAEYTPPANHGDHCAELLTYTKKTNTIN